jgi:hypothetical protein
MKMSALAPCSSSRRQIDAAIQQHVGDRNSSRLVERLLPVASSNVNKRGIRANQLPEPVDPAQSLQPRSVSISLCCHSAEGGHG